MYLSKIGRLTRPSKHLRYCFRFSLFKRLIYGGCVKKNLTLDLQSELEEQKGPGLVVMGDSSCLKGRGFNSHFHILNGHFFTLICCKNCIVCLKRLKINKKEAGVDTFFSKK